ncbi:MAG: TraR/DksA C4-type zinc finger protein [Magnetospirillum sp.]|nr:TraR/DksA C4-type zinc finger protein [Magnetospirillum sp.]
MADASDLATEREDRDREAALAAFRDRRRLVAESQVFCLSCGGRIPEARRHAVPGTNVCGFCARQLTPLRRMGRR